MHSRNLTIINRLGLHARAAAKLVTVASGFGAEIHLKRGDHSVNAKSIMGVMMLAAAQGIEIRVEAEGDDAVEALDAIEDLVADRFGEAQ